MPGYLVVVITEQKDFSIQLQQVSAKAQCIELHTVYVCRIKPSPQEHAKQGPFWDDTSCKLLTIITYTFNLG